MHFGRPGDEYPDILLLASCFVFMMCDAYYVLWAVHLQMNLPDELRTPTMAALQGSSAKLEVVTKSYLEKGQSKASDTFKKAAGMYKAKQHTDTEEVE